MKKVNVELIIPDGVSLHAIAGIIQQGCQNFVVVKEMCTVMESPQVTLSPELVVESERNDNKLTLLLTERPHYERQRACRCSDEEE